MNSNNHYYFKGLLLFALFEILYVLTYFTSQSITGSAGIINLLELASFFLGLMCLMFYFLLGLNEFGKKEKG